MYRLIGNLANPLFGSDDIQVVANQVRPPLWNSGHYPLGALYTVVGSYDASIEHHGVTVAVDTPFKGGAVSVWPLAGGVGGPGVLMQNDTYDLTSGALIGHSTVKVYKGGYWLLIERCPYSYYHSTGYVQVSIMKGSNSGSGFDSGSVVLYSNSFVYKPDELAISVFGHATPGSLQIKVYTKQNGATNFTNLMNIVDSSPLYTSGYCGINLFGGDTSAWFDNYRAGAINVPTPIYTVITDVQNIQEPFWSPDGTEVLDHYEYAAPSWDYREWISLAFKPSDLSHRSFAHSPLDPNDSNFTRYDDPIVGDAWQPENGTPPFSRSSYIPTWFRDSIAMTSSMQPDPDDPGDNPDNLAYDMYSFIYIDYKKLDGTIGWLAVDTQGEQGWFPPYTGPAYLKGGFVGERMLITGLSRASYFEDEQLA